MTNWYRNAWKLGSSVSWLTSHCTKHLLFCHCFPSILATHRMLKIRGEMKPSLSGCTSVVTVVKSSTMKARQSIHKCLFSSSGMDLHCYSSDMLNFKNPKIVSVVEQKLLDRNGFHNKVGCSTEGSAHSLSDCGLCLTISKHFSERSRKSILTKVVECPAGRLSAEKFRQL